jgi:hypothetical protein
MREYPGTPVGLVLLLVRKLEQKLMSLLTPLDDFVTRTLRAIPGLLARIEYVSSLKKDGRYEHWGLTRVHGVKPAERAIGDAHKMLIAEVLQTPIRVLVEDNAAICAAEGLEMRTYLEGLQTRRTTLLPGPRNERASELHFNSVLRALWVLARAQSSATHLSA